jgi:EAL domain-containing protein (putative c-di-GMP-specific phosphodiesterase class I)
LDAALAGLRVVYQPLVHLETGQVLGYEALARGGGELECPETMLAAAREQGRSAEVDWACRSAALAGALEARLGGSLTLLVNVEPDTPAPIPEQCAELLDAASSQLRVVLEVTERAVVQQPAELLRLVDWARDRSWGIALDDIGEDPGSLALMPFLEPDIIKLDLRLVQSRPSAEIGLIMSAVLAQAERTGAQVVAEGIENEVLQESALALGATLGQGWLYGRPVALPSDLARSDDVVPLKRSWAVAGEVTPFGLVRAALPLRRGSKAQLVGIASHLEEQAMAWSEGPVVLSTFSAGEDLDAATTARYADLAGRGSFVAALRAGHLPAVAEGVRSAAFPHDHRLGDEWSVVVVGPHYAGALVARQVSPDGDYDFVVTHQRDLVVEAGRALLRHVAPGGDIALI